MRKILIICISGAAATGCVSITEDSIDNPTTIRTVQQQIDCELKEAFPPPDQKNTSTGTHWTVTYSITQNIIDTSKIGIDPLTWITPAKVDKFNLGLTAGINNEKERNAKAEFSRDLLETAKIDCPQNQSKKPAFGFKNWSDQVMKVDEEVISSFGYTITLTTSGAAGINSSFAESRIEVDGGLGGSRSAKQTVDFGFSKYSPSRPLDVRVVNFPASRSQSLESLPQPKANKAKPFSGTSTRPLYSIPFENLLQNRNTIQQLQLDRIERR